jgi:hypothetical protein
MYCCASAFKMLPQDIQLNAEACLLVSVLPWLACIACFTIAQQTVFECMYSRHGVGCKLNPWACVLRILAVHELHFLVGNRGLLSPCTRQQYLHLLLLIAEAALS